jgi:Cu/Ag efflux pump CusA
MTAFSFILGVLPLVIASGAGAASRHSLGTSVFGGMLVATILGCFVTPSLYVIFRKLSSEKQAPPPDESSDNRDAQKNQTAGDS